MNKKIEYGLSVPKSFYACIKLFGFKQALRLPLLVHYKTKLMALKRGAMLVDKQQFASVRIGFSSVGIYDIKRSVSILALSGFVHFHGSAFFGQGTRLVVGPKGWLDVGDNFCSTAELKMVCYDQITIAPDALLAWEVVVMDSNFHIARNIESDQLSSYTKPIYIGRNAWIGMRSIILPGTSIPDGSVVGTASVCNKDYIESQSLIAGNPAKTQKTGVSRVSEAEELEVVRNFYH